MKPLSRLQVFFWIATAWVQPLTRSRVNRRTHRFARLLALNRSLRRVA